MIIQWLQWRMSLCKKNFTLKYSGWWRIRSATCSQMTESGGKVFVIHLQLQKSGIVSKLKQKKIGQVPVIVVDYESSTQAPLPNPGMHALTAVHTAAIVSRDTWALHATSLLNLPLGSVVTNACLVWGILAHPLPWGGVVWPHYRMIHCPGHPMDQAKTRMHQRSHLY